MIDKTVPSKTMSTSGLQTLLNEPKQKAWWRRPLIWGGVGLVVCAVAGAYFWQLKTKNSGDPTYVTTPAAQGNLTLSVSANGTLQPTRSVSIGSELSGTVLRVLVDVNDKVKKGQVLVELDTAKLNDQVARSRASLGSATAMVAQAVATASEARGQALGGQSAITSRAGNCPR